MSITQKPGPKQKIWECILFGVITAVGVVLLVSMLAASLIANEKLGETVMPAIVVIALFLGAYAGGKVVTRGTSQKPNIWILIFAIIMLAMMYAVTILVFDCQYGDMKYSLIGTAAGCFAAILGSGRTGKGRSTKHSTSNKRLYKMHIG